jgi:hypothetical protein
MIAAGSSGRVVSGVGAVPVACVRGFEVTAGRQGRGEGRGALPGRV